MTTMSEDKQGNRLAGSSIRSTKLPRTTAMAMAMAMAMVCCGLASSVLLEGTHGFVVAPSRPRAPRHLHPALRRESQCQIRLSMSSFAGEPCDDDDDGNNENNQDEDAEDDDEDDEDEDDYIDTESLGDWRSFRRNLAMGDTKDESNNNTNNTNNNNNNNNNLPSPSEKKAREGEERVITENETVLRTQNEKLADEYATDLWAYETPKPEVGGLVLRMPIEVELYRNYKHSIMGSKLRAMLIEDGKARGDADADAVADADADTDAEKGGPVGPDDLEMSHWYGRSSDLVEEQMKKIADKADEEGQIDASTLPEDHAEMLTLYLENQEEWQEVCLVLEQSTSSGGSRSSKTVVLNRPMAFKLTKDLARVVYLGSYGIDSVQPETARRLTRFATAFREECAVCVGGPDHQGEPAILVHGISGLEGASEISPGTGIYRGGLEAAIDGVLDGLYSPLEFRFFVGCHDYQESMLDVEVMLGKLQPVACSRVLPLKQCISLPKPLWHEVMELCGGGDLPDISVLEMRKHEDVTFQVLEEDEIEIEIDGETSGLASSAADFGILMIDDEDEDDELDIEILDDDGDDAPWGW